MPVEIMRRDINLKTLRQRRNLHRLPNTVPGDINNRNIHCLIFKKRTITTQAEQRLTRCNRCLHRAPDQSKCRRVVDVDFKPSELQIIQGSGDGQVTLGSIVKVEIQKNIDIPARPFPESLQLRP